MSPQGTKYGARSRFGKWPFRGLYCMSLQILVCLRLSRGHGIIENPYVVVYFGPDQPITF